MRSGLAAVNPKHPLKPPPPRRLGGIFKKSRTFWISSRDKTKHRDHERFDLKRHGRPLRAPVCRDRNKAQPENSWTNTFDPRQIEALWRADRRIRQGQKITKHVSHPGQGLAHRPEAAAGPARHKRTKPCPWTSVPASDKQSCCSLRLSCRARGLARQAPEIP